MCKTFMLVWPVHWESVSGTRLHSYSFICFNYSFLQKDSMDITSTPFGVCFLALENVAFYVSNVSIGIGVVLHKSSTRGHWGTQILAASV